MIKLTKDMSMLTEDMSMLIEDMSKLTEDMKKKIIESAEHEPAIPKKDVTNETLLNTYLKNCDNRVLDDNIKSMLIGWFPRGDSRKDALATVEALYTFTNHPPGNDEQKIKKTKITNVLNKFIADLIADNEKKNNKFLDSDFKCMFQRLLRNILVDVVRKHEDINIISKHLNNHKARQNIRYTDVQQNIIDKLFTELINETNREYIFKKLELRMKEMEAMDPPLKCTNYSNTNILTGKQKSSQVIAKDEIAEVEKTIVTEEEEEMFNDILKLNYTNTDPLLQPSIIPAPIDGFSIIRDYNCKLSTVDFIQLSEQKTRKNISYNVNFPSRTFVEPQDRDQEIQSDITAKAQNIKIEGTYWDYIYEQTQQSTYSNHMIDIYNIFNDETLDEQSQFVKSLDIIKNTTNNKKKDVDNKTIPAKCESSGFRENIKRYCLHKMKAIYKNKELAKYNLFLLLQKIICMTGKCDTGSALFSSKEVVDRLNFNKTGFWNFFTSPGIDHEGARHLARDLSRLVRFTFITYWQLYKLGFVSPVELVESYEKTKASRYWEVNKIPLMASLSMIATNLTVISKLATTANLTSIANTAGNIFKISTDTIQKISLAFPFVGAGIATIAGCMAFIYSTNFYKQRSEDYSVYMYFHKCRREFEYNFNIFCDKIKMSPYKIYVDVPTGDNSETFESCNWLSIRHETTIKIDKSKRKHPDFVKRILYETGLTRAQDLALSGRYLFDNEFMVPENELYENSLHRKKGGDPDTPEEFVKIPDAYFWRENNSENTVSQHCNYWDDAQEYINLFSLLLKEITIYNYKVSECYDKQIKILFKFIKLYRIICSEKKEDFIDKNNEIQILNKQLEFIYSIDGCKQFDNSYYSLYTQSVDPKYLSALLAFSAEPYSKKKTLLLNKQDFISYNFVLNDSIECSTDKDMNEYDFYNTITGDRKVSIGEENFSRQKKETHIRYSEILQERRKNHMNKIIKLININDHNIIEEAIDQANIIIEEAIDQANIIIKETIDQANTWEKVADHLKHIETQKYKQNNPNMINKIVLLNNIEEYREELIEIFTFYGTANNLWNLLENDQTNKVKMRDKDFDDITARFSQSQISIAGITNNVSKVKTVLDETLNRMRNFSMKNPGNEFSDNELLLEINEELPEKNYEIYIISLLISIRIIQQLIKRLIRIENNLISRHTKYKSRYPANDFARLTAISKKITKEHSYYSTNQPNSAPTNPTNQPSRLSQLNSVFTTMLKRPKGGNKRLTRKVNTNHKRRTRQLKTNHKRRTRQLKMNKTIKNK